MNPTLHAQILTLRKYQAWRTGEDERTMDEAGIVPAAITSALDAVLEIADSHLRDATNPAGPAGVPGDESSIRHHVDQKSGGKSSEKDLRNIIANARALLAKYGQQGYTSEHSPAAPNICSEHCAPDATRYRLLRSMPQGLKILAQVAPGEWEEILSGDDLDGFLKEYPQ